MWVEVPHIVCTLGTCSLLIRLCHKSGASCADVELEKLPDLPDKGIITDEEFDQKKKQLLGL